MYRWWSLPPAFLLSGRRTKASVHFLPQFPRRDHTVAAPGDDVCLSRRSVLERPDQSRFGIHHHDLSDPPFLIEMAFPQNAREGVVGREDLDCHFERLSRIRVADAAFRGDHIRYRLVSGIEF